ncbi:hypothetical protein C2E23DRAFT_724722 [Lenzites betulinus]|nr:hypothetical protein C2E23DRAFT_724722 [Lenzites betulinus]
MDTLPVETVWHIFELACTDGGATGNTLVLVSKDFRAVARKARFHSISLTVTEQCILAFSALYERECDPVQGDKPLIRHLLVSFSQTRDAIAARGPSTARRTGGNIMPWTCHSRLCVTSRCLFSEYASAAQSIFRLAAPGLVTLVVQGVDTMCCRPSAFPIINNPLPSLREATFVNVVDIRALLSKELTSEVAETPIFPALTHLSASLPGSWVSVPALEFWPAAAPRVTHLSVADAQWGVEPLASAVGVRCPNIVFNAIHPSSAYEPLPPSSDEPPPEPTYPSVQHLLLRPSMGPGEVPIVDEWMVYIAWIRGLGQIARDCQERGVEVFVLMPSKDPTSLDDRYKVAHREWLERIEGGSDGAGCWRHLAVLRGCASPCPSPIYHTCITSTPRGVPGRYNGVLRRLVCRK